MENAAGSDVHALTFVRILVLILVFFGGIASGAPSRRALVIGNSNYASLCPTETPLTNVVAMREALTRAGFTVDAGSRNDQDAATLPKALNAFLDTIETGDIAFIYFSGYAILAEDANWLLPVDFRPNDDVEDKGYSLNRILEQMEKKKVSAGIAALDATRLCNKLPATAAGLGLTIARVGTLISFSAPALRTVEDPTDGSVDAYTSGLAKNIITPGSTPESVFKSTPLLIEQAVGSFYFVDPPVQRPVTIEVRAPLRAGQLRPNPIDQLTYSWIPEGKFLMGCVTADEACGSNEKPQHEVYTHGFWITTTEVPVKEYQRFAEKSGKRKLPESKTNEKGKLTDLPASEVAWQDAADYCKWAGGSSNGRLPSEAEWEKAARGGKENSIYPWGIAFDPEKATSTETGKTRGQRYRERKKFTETTPVAFYDPNGYGLYDVAGNVREWTLDAYDPDAYKKPPPFRDPIVNTGLKDERVLRGGAWDENHKTLRLSARDHWSGSKGDNKTGFRCVVSEVQDAADQ